MEILNISDEDLIAELEASVNRFLDAGGHLRREDYGVDVRDQHVVPDAMSDGCACLMGALLLHPSERIKDAIDQAIRFHGAGDGDDIAGLLFGKERRRAIVEAFDHQYVPTVVVTMHPKLGDYAMRKSIEHCPDDEEGSDDDNDD